MKIGFIGTGIMGSAMAHNLVKKGYEVVVYNRTKAKADSLVSAGAGWADSPAQLGQVADILFTMVSTPEAVEKVTLGPNGFLQSMRPGNIWVNSSTVNPSFAVEMEKKAQERGVHFVDAPVAGSRGPAERAELTFYVGGDPADVSACRPLLEAMGREAVHIGAVGTGSAMKMVVNLIAGEGMLALAEGVVLGQGLGISRETLLDVLFDSIVIAPNLRGKKEKIGQDQYEPDFPLRWMYKDMHLVALSAYEQGVSVPGANTAKEVYALAVRRGMGGDDFAAVYRLLEEKVRVGDARELQLQEELREHGRGL